MDGRDSPNALWWRLHCFSVSRQIFLYCFIWETIELLADRIHD